jgi:hypothetical protein
LEIEKGSAFPWGCLSKRKVVFPISFCDVSLGEEQYCVSLLDIPVPNFHNLKNFHNLPGVVCQEEHIYVYQLFL